MYRKFIKQKVHFNYKSYIKKLEEEGSFDAVPRKKLRFVKSRNKRIERKVAKAWLLYVSIKTHLAVEESFSGITKQRDQNVLAFVHSNEAPSKFPYSFVSLIFHSINLRNKLRVLKFIDGNWGYVIVTLMKNSPLWNF